MLVDEEQHWVQLQLTTVINNLGRMMVKLTWKVSSLAHRLALLTHSQLLYTIIIFLYYIINFYCIIKAISQKQKNVGMALAYKVHIQVAVILQHHSTQPSLHKQLQKKYQQVVTCTYLQYTGMVMWEWYWVVIILSCTLQTSALIFGIFLGGTIPTCNVYTCTIVGYSSGNDWLLIVLAPTTPSFAHCRFNKPCHNSNDTK